MSTASEEDTQTEGILEARRVTRVSSKGKKTKKIKCQKGYKRSGNKCVPITGAEKTAKKRAAKKASRTKRASPGSQKKATRKRLKAMKKRSSMGYK